MSDPQPIIPVSQTLLYAATKIGLTARALLPGGQASIMPLAGSTAYWRAPRTPHSHRPAELAIVYAGKDLASARGRRRPESASISRDDMSLTHTSPTHLDVEDKVPVRLSVLHFLLNLLFVISASYTFWAQPRSWAMDHAWQK